MGRIPLPVPPSIQFSLPAAQIDPSIGDWSSPAATRTLVVTGPLGSLTVPIRPPVILAPPTPGDPHLHISVHDPAVKQHKAWWGTTRTMIANAIIGVTEGYKIDLRLVGVGYRAAVEPIPQVFQDLARQLPSKRNFREGFPTQRLNLKLGYSHPVLVDIPSNISVSIPQPTIISLSCINKHELGLFAAQVRRWRKPEPYRGKVNRPSYVITVADWDLGCVCRGRDNQAEGGKEEVMRGASSSQSCMQYTSQARLPVQPKFRARVFFLVALLVTAQNTLPEWGHS